MPTKQKRLTPRSKPQRERGLTVTSLLLQVDHQNGFVMLAHPGAKPGRVGQTSRRVVQVNEIPDGTDSNDVVRAYKETADMTHGKGVDDDPISTMRYVFTFAEIGNGRILMK